MSLEINTLDHICNVARRQISEERKDLSLLFIVYEPGKSAAALNAKRHEIYKFPTGDVVFPHLRKIAQPEFDKTVFIGLHKITEKRWLPPFKREHMLALFFINSAHFDTPEDAKRIIYHEIWHALSLSAAVNAGKKDTYTEHSGILSPVYDDGSLARNNMLGDAFTAIMLEFSGQRKKITSLSRERCQETLQVIPNHKPELYPYPIAADATQLVFEDLRDELLEKTKPFTLAQQMTEEIGFTFDETTLGQWKNFAERAQEMAWMGLDKNKILSAAIYSSEDTYVRSMAYLVAETLNLEPRPQAETKTHNPFTDQEVNARQHIKAAQSALNNILSKLSQKDDRNLFIEAARAQNAKLLTGHVTGWCADALLETSKIYAEQADENTNYVETAKEKFKTAMLDMPWRTLLNLNRIILKKRREQITITPELIIEICTQNEDMAPIALAFEIAPPSITQIAETTQTAPEKPAPPEQEKTPEELLEEESPLRFE